MADLQNQRQQSTHLAQSAVVPTQAHNHMTTQSAVSPSQQLQDPILLPTVAQLSDFLQSFFPVRPRDVKFHYHVPRRSNINHANKPVSRLVLGVTPTQPFYDALDRHSRFPPTAFLHRPFDLDRTRVKAGITVLSSHTGFDEVLTVGYNVALAARLGMAVDDCVCLQGYKGDPDRRIGIVGVLPSGSTWGSISASIAQQFDLGGDAVAQGPSADEEVAVVAIMNAFAPAEVERVMDAALCKGWINDMMNGKKVLYLTGQAREAGVLAVQARSMKLVCVGHLEAEVWGIRYLASKVRRAFPEITVEERAEEHNQA
ncbi:hypothetical protein MBLNU459_g3979t3 [Dothideomycetes sp. NU459]